jgi:hypothetical protein
MVGFITGRGRILGAALACSLGVALVGITSADAHARDLYPCVAKDRMALKWSGVTFRPTRYTCPMRGRDHIPVYFTTKQGSPIVGYLDGLRKRNFRQSFLFEARGGPTFFEIGRNVYWGSTQADNGRWGWVNEVYFAGAPNNEDDAGLLLPGPMTCNGPCPTTRPSWMFPPRWVPGGARP